MDKNISRHARDQLGASLFNRDKTVSGGAVLGRPGAGGAVLDQVQVARFRGELEPGGAVCVDDGSELAGARRGESGMAGACIIQAIHIYGCS